MPVISRFSGIIIKMYLRQSEHNPPHIHAICGDCAGIFSIADGEMFEGDIPSKEQRLIQKFIDRYRSSLYHMRETQSFHTLPFEKEV